MSFPVQESTSGITRNGRFAKSGRPSTFGVELQPDNGGNLDPGTSLPVRTQETVPVDLVKTMVGHVFEDQKTPTNCHITVLISALQ